MVWRAPATLRPWSMQAVVPRENRSTEKTGIKRDSTEGSSEVLAAEVGWAGCPSVLSSRVEAACAFMHPVGRNELTFPLI